MNGNLVRTFKNEHSFSNMCRVCLAWSGDSMPSIFDFMKNDNPIPITEVINNLTNISIKEGDGLPERICDSCLVAIERIVEFKQLCEQTDSNLRTFLLSLNGKNGLKSSASGCDVEKGSAVRSNGDGGGRGGEEVELGERGGDGVYSSISERICVESEVVVVDPSCSVYDENQNQPPEVVYYGDPANNRRYDEEWSGGVGGGSGDQSTTGGHSVFDWEVAEGGVGGVDNSSYDTVESLTYDKLVAQTGGANFNYYQQQQRHLAEPSGTNNSCSDDDVELMETTYKCATCHKAFHTQKWLERHSQLHDDTQCFPCDYCYRSFAGMEELVRHWREHAGPGRDFCRVCGEPYTDPKQQRSHQTMHAAAAQPHACPLCRTGFPNGAEMHRHMLATHPGQTAESAATPSGASAAAADGGVGLVHRCGVCHKCFGRRSNLMKHMLALHSGFRPHRCSTCGKTFASKSDLARHTSTHTGERPHSCPVCLYSFSRRDKLVRHMRTHSSERPYTCDLCDTRFKWKDKLLRHVRTHQDQDRDAAQLHLYRCKQCQDSFSSRPQLTRHILDMHDTQTVQQPQPIVRLDRIDGGSAVVRNES